MEALKKTITEPFFHTLENLDLIRLNGRVTQVIGLLIESLGPEVSVGELCLIIPKDKKETIRAEVVGFRENKVLLLSLGKMEGISPGSRVIATGTPLQVGVSDKLLGRVLNGLGQPMDDLENYICSRYYPIYNTPPNPLSRKRIKETLCVGIRAIDGLCTIGKGQRMGIFAGSGVGKSTLLGMIARNTSADINVIGLIGERGREVREFIERDLGTEGLKRSVVVVATGDQPPLIRIKAAFVSTAIAEYFRDQGKNVMLMMDSVTRFAMAQREVGLSIGEPPATKGYTPSVFSLLPKILERAGTSDKGSITGLYTVLVEGDDMDEPVADSVRGILDGHIILSRKLAHQNHYPAIDILGSISRLMTEIANESHVKAAGFVRNMLSVYTEAESLINIGAYAAGSNQQIDRSIEMRPKIMKFLSQGISENADYDDTLESIIGMASSGKV